jgi:gas vesicle protein
MKSTSTGYTDYSNAGTDYTDSQDDLKKILIGALAGAAVGALVGSAFTEKGKKVTSRITESTKHLAENLKEKAEATGVADSLVHVYEAAKDSVVDTISKEAQNFTSGGNKSNS